MFSLDRKTLAQFLPNREAIAAFEKMFKVVGGTLPNNIEEALALAAQAQATAAAALTMLAEVSKALTPLETAPAAVPVTESDSYSPALIPTTEADDYAPRVHLGTISSQDADNVSITGGSITGLTTNNATSITLTDDTTTNATMYPAFGTGAGTSALKISTTKLTWNPSTGLLTAPSVSAQLNGTLGLTTPAAAAVTTLSASGQLTSTVATGTAPFSVASSTVVPNLNVSQLLGGTWAVPGAIGSSTPNTGVFTQLSIGGQTTGIADFRTSTGAVVVAGRTSNAGVGSQPGAYAVYSPNAIGTVLIWGQLRVSISNATAGSEACSLIFSTRVGGSFVDCFKVDDSGNSVNLKGVADQAYSYQTPATGFSITIGAGIRTLILDPSGTLATGTITMPAAPVDGQKIRISSSQNITALTVSANAGQSIKNAPTAFTTSTTGPQGYEFEYRSTNTTWYRLQ
jgi:hypothetical protein